MQKLASVFVIIYYLCKDHIVLLKKTHVIVNFINEFETCHYVFMIYGQHRVPIINCI